MANQKLCSVPDCGKKFLAKGFCRAHYSRYRLYGDPCFGGTSPGKPADFLARALELQTDDCVIWQFARSSFGYPKIWRDGRLAEVHRIVCTEIHGPPPTDKHEAAHSCGNGKDGCINGRHLTWKTRAENEADKLKHGTTNRGARNGQACLTEDNVRFIREAKGLTHKQMAKMFNVSSSTICSIRMRQRWAWLT